MTVLRASLVFPFKDRKVIPVSDRQVAKRDCRSSSDRGKPPLSNEGTKRIDWAPR